MARKIRQTPEKLLTTMQVMSAGDGDTSDGGGLLLRVSQKTNSQSWVLRFTAPCGRRREMGLGRADRSSLAAAGKSLTEARRKARDAKILLEKGIDPIDHALEDRASKAAAKAAVKAEKQKEELTLCRAARLYHEEVIEPNQSDKHARQWLSSLENHLPDSIWHKAVGEVTEDELLTALRTAKKHELARRENGLRETMRRVRQRLDAVYEHARFKKWTSINPAAMIRGKLSEGISKKKQNLAKRSHAAVPFKQAPALMARIRAAEGTAARCLEFTVLCAARTNEALGCRWSEIDLEDKTWTIPGERMKTGLPHTVYLSNMAVEVLRGQLGQDATYVFPSPMPSRKGKPLSNMAMLTVLSRLEVRGMTTVHGMARQTFSSWANELNIARHDVVESALAHTEGNKVRAAYNKATYDAERRQLMDAWSTFLTADNVVQLKLA